MMDFLDWITVIHLAISLLVFVGSWMFSDVGDEYAFWNALTVALIWPLILLIMILVVVVAVSERRKDINGETNRE